MSDLRHEDEAGMFELKAGLRYEMPVVFGPSVIPDVTAMAGSTVATVRFLTDRAALQRLTPAHFELAEEPVVSVAHAMYRGVDYLAGRGYNVVRIGLPVRFTGVRDTVVGPYHAVIWESDVNPILLGREWGGYAKIVGEIPDAERKDDCYSFALSEYGTLLMSGVLSGLEPMGEDAFAKLRNSSKTTSALGWKYIAGPGGEVDADYPTELVTHYAHDRAWTGAGEIDFNTPSWAQAPVSSRVLEVLEALPILDWLPATITEGQMTLPRSAVRRLH